MKLLVKAVLSSSIVLMVLLTTGAQALELPDFREIVKQNSPAVVKIIVQQESPRAVETRRRQPSPEELPEYLRRFFEQRGAPQPQRPRMGMGSGFIISDDGFIVTNNHVVQGASSVLVRMNDRREFDAQVVGTDPRSDLALLRISAKNLPVLALAESEDLEVGEWVLAIGSPFGLDYSVTAGIVSAKGRSLPTESNENYVPFIQTDVAINPGNSGGPLFNLEGQVVGVNSQIFTRSGGSIGLSFAIPVSVVRNIVAQLQDDGRVTRGWLGVTIQDVDKSLADSFGLDRPKGALIVQLSEGGPAAESGLEAGDVIVRFDGKDIPASSDLPHVVGLIKPGSKVPVEVIRDRKRKTLKVKVGGLDANDSYSLNADDSEDSYGGRMGVVVADASKEILERWGIPAGVVVREVVPGQAGADAGLMPGDVITFIGSTPIKSVKTFERVLDKLRAGDSVPLRLVRRGAPLFIGLKVKD